MLERLSFSAIVNEQYVGLLTLEFPFKNNSNIYWMAVKREYQEKHIGSSLMKRAEEYCYENRFTSLTVETLSPKMNDPNYLKTYRFYEKSGFQPLFELTTYGPEVLMVYMQKVL